MENVLFPMDIDVSSLEYSELRPFGEHAKIVYIKHKGSQLLIQTPLMKLPYGLGKYDDGERCKYSLDLSFGGDSPKVTALKNKLEEIDSKVLDDSVTNSLNWFKKKKQTKEVSQALFTPAVKVAMSEGEPTDKYPPTFKAKLHYSNDKFRVLCFDQDKQPVNPDLNALITKGQSVRAIVQLVGLWFAGSKFGISYEVKQLKMNPSSTISTYAFAEDSDEEETTAVEVEEPSTTENNYVLDSEDEDDL